MKAKIIGGFVVIANTLLAQSNSKVLAFRDYMDMVVGNHPIVKQGALLSSLGKAELLAARYHFDPKLDYEFTRKKFKATTYYEYLDYGLKIPTWTGVDLKTGYQQNSGQFINPFDFTPPGGLMYVGAETSLERLFFDERRNTVRQAQMMSKIAETEQVKLINKVLFTAAKDYWDWYFQFNRLTAIQKNYQLSKDRYEGLVNRLAQGDVASIDTLEAALGLDERYIELQDAENDLQNAEFALANHLWTEDGYPLELESGTKPEDIIQLEVNQDTSIVHLLKFAEENHPEILKSKYKIRQAYFERKFWANDIIPHVGFSLRFYAVPSGNSLDFSVIDEPYLINNYKAQLSFSQSLFFRKEIGKYRQSKYKYQNAKFDFAMNKLKVANELRSVQTDVLNYITLTNIQAKNLQRSRTLYQAEITRFELGESSLFLVISRESKVLESEVKLYSLKAKLQKTKIELGHAVGKIEW